MVASDHARSTGIMINHAKTIHKGMLETANFLVQTRNNIGFIMVYPYSILAVLNVLAIHSRRGIELQPIR
jgi:hypothetical protein